MSLGHSSCRQASQRVLLVLAPVPGPGGLQGTFRWPLPVLWVSWRVTTLPGKHGGQTLFPLSHGMQPDSCLRSGQCPAYAVVLQVRSGLKKCAIYRTALTRAEVRLDVATMAY